MRAEGLDIYPLRESIAALLSVAARYNLSLGPTYAAPGFAADASCFPNDISQCSCGVKKAQHLVRLPQRKILGERGNFC